MKTFKYDLEITVNGNYIYYKLNLTRKELLTLLVDFRTNIEGLDAHITTKYFVSVYDGVIDLIKIIDALVNYEIKTEV